MKKIKCFIATGYNAEELEIDLQTKLEKNDVVDIGETKFLLHATKLTCIVFYI